MLGEEIPPTPKTIITDVFIFSSLLERNCNMTEDYIKGSGTGRGGWRGGGRPKGATQKKPKVNPETNFHVRCSYAQREKLKAYWQTIKDEQ